MIRLRLLLATDFGKQFLNVRIIAKMLPGVITEAMKNTIVFTAIGFTFGIALGLVFALARVSRRPWLRWPAAVFIDVVRGLPALLTIVLIGYGLPIAFKFRWPLGRLGDKYIPGCSALAIVAAAYLAESIRAGIEAVPRGQMEAARSLGMSYPLAMRKIVVPQALRIVLPPLTNELCALLKDTSLIAVLGVSIGGRELLQYARAFSNAEANTTPLIVAGVAYLIITIPLLQLVAALDRRAKAAVR